MAGERAGIALNFRMISRGTTALALCADPALDCLITEEVAFADLPARHEAIMATDAPGIATIIRYE